MYRFSVIGTTLAVCLGFAAATQARPPDERHNEGNQERSHRDERRERADEHRRRPEAPANSAVEAPPASPSVAEAPPAVASAAQANAARFREHNWHNQQQARSHRKEAQKDPKAWNDARAQRAASHRSDVAKNWGQVADRPDARAELALHADRMARLNRALDLAEQKGDTNLINQTNDLISKEIARDANAMARIPTPAGAQ